MLASEEQPDVLLKLGQVHELVGHWEQAGVVYGQALEQAERRGHLAEQARVWLPWPSWTANAAAMPKRSERLVRAKEIFTRLDDQDGIAQVLHFLGTLTSIQGDFQTARGIYEASLAIRRQQGDNAHAASLLSNLGIGARALGNYEEARRMHDEALALRREIGDKWAIATSFSNLGNVATDQGQYDEARHLHEQALSLRRDVGDMWQVANSLINLGNQARGQGDYQQALARYLESLKISREYDDRWTMAYLLEDMGCLAALQNQPERALHLAGAAEGLRHAIGASRSTAEQQKLEAGLDNARQALGETAANERLEEGRRMSLEQAAALAAASA